MKKQMILPLAALMIGCVALCFAACSKQHYESSAPPGEAPSLRLIPTRNAMQMLTDSSGAIHNAVLGTLYNGAGIFPTPLDFASYLVRTANERLVNAYGFDPLPRSFLQSSEADIVKLMSNNFYLLRKPQMDSLMNDMIDQLEASPLIDNDEKSLFSQSRHIFDVDASMPEQTAFDSIIARAGRLLAIYNSRSWPEGEGHAIGGFLNIAKSSAQFWKSRLVVSEYTKALPPWIKGWGFPQFDAAGYIIGWGKAWLWDELPTEKKRIGAGLSKAAEWSGISGWFK
jgi:hypothetical protein